MSQSSLLNDTNELQVISSPTVSVIVPAYNHEEYITDCIQSILKQDYPYLDLIVINDGSTDKTDLRIKELLKNNPSRLRYVTKENEGLIKTLNLGLKLAQGEFFCELASDDMLLPGSIRNRVSYLEKNPDIDVVFADAYILEGKTRTTVRASEGKTRFSSSKHTVVDLLKGNARILFPSGMFRKSSLEKLSGFDEDFRYYEDVAIMYKLALDSRIGYLDEPVMYYRKHWTNISSSNKVLVRREKILAFEKLLSLNKADVGLTKYFLYREYIKFIKFSIRNNVAKEDVLNVYTKSKKIRTFTVKNHLYMALSRLVNTIWGNETI